MTRQYQDYCGKTFDTIDKLAAFRVKVPGPALGGMKNPAKDANWVVIDRGCPRNPYGNEIRKLRSAVHRLQKEL